MLAIRLIQCIVDRNHSVVAVESTNTSEYDVCTHVLDINVEYQKHHCQAQVDNKTPLMTVMIIYYL